MTQIQDLVDGTPVRGALCLRGGEYEGPLRIGHALTIDGRGSTVWARSGPVLIVESDEVQLRHLRIEVTDPQGHHPRLQRLALQLCPGSQVLLDNVTVHGLVEGLPGEDGEWAYPADLSLGALAPRALNQFLIRLQVPLPSQLVTRVAGVELEPSALPAGVSEVKVTIRGVPADTLLMGSIEIRSPHLTRLIALSGSTLGGGMLASAGAPRLLWQPPRVPAPGPSVSQRPPPSPVVSPAPAGRPVSVVVPPSVVTVPIAAPASVASPPPAAPLPIGESRSNYVRFDNPLSGVFQTVSAASPQTASTGKGSGTADGPVLSALFSSPAPPPQTESRSEDEVAPAPLSQARPGAAGPAPLAEPTAQPRRPAEAPHAAPPLLSKLFKS